MYTYEILNQKRLEKNFWWLEIDLKTGSAHLKVKISRRPNIGMWGVYPEAMAWNVGAVHSEINLGERIWRNSSQRANFNVHFEICPFGATSPDTLTQIVFWVLSANIPGHCLWIDTPHVYVWASWNFHFSMGGPRFQVSFPPSKISWKPFWDKYPISIYKMAAKNASRFLKTLLLTFLTRPSVQLHTELHIAQYTQITELENAHWSLPTTNYTINN